MLCIYSFKKYHFYFFKFIAKDLNTKAMAISGKITEIFCRKMSTICTASLTDKKLNFFCYYFHDYITVMSIMIKKN